MPGLLFPYLLGIVATLVVLMAAGWAYFLNHRSALLFRERERRLPEATHWADLSYRIRDLEEKHADLASALGEAERTIEEADRDRTWLSQHAEELAAAKAEYEQMEQRRAELVAVNEQVAEARERVHKLDLEAAKAEFHKQYAEERAKDLDDRANKLEQSLTDIEQRRLQVQAKLDEAIDKRSEVQEEHARLGQSVSERKVELEALERKIEDARRRLEESAKAVKTTQSAYDDLETQRRKTDVDVKALEAEHKSLQKNVNKLIDTRSTLAPETRGVKASVAALWEPVLHSEDFADGEWAPESEQDAIETVQQYLEQWGLRFHPRVVRAFHTSLKITKESPLLVLAGISGTGKSLLPRRYAEAMGFHFLNVPVQPRWDGPQDLLGFFNYLDGQYKATELARALVQMDPIGPTQRSWPGVPDDWDEMLNERMLIVLLDEMNLARVEYYFSEFLSRLETRRDIDISDEPRRRAAEIILETGQHGASSEVRVFPDQNVLFVGTINEDESTQTLSDKVIDRANVMRFGRPHKLQTDLSANGDVEVASSLWLARATWDSWNEARVGVDIPLAEEVDVWLDRINAALERVGRPFGFRTGNAIREYVRQYPDHSEDGIRCAMADQIEQRVLPKLRGLDPSDRGASELLRALLDITRELGDSELSEAIQKGMAGHGGHLFVWYGMERQGDD